jgi:hypothetical protein
MRRRELAAYLTSLTSRRHRQANNRLVRTPAECSLNAAAVASDIFSFVAAVSRRRPDWPAKMLRNQRPFTKYARDNVR